MEVGKTKQVMFLAEKIVGLAAGLGTFHGLVSITLGRIGIAGDSIPEGVFGITKAAVVFTSRSSANCMLRSISYTCSPAPSI
jgi:hypothetical protein